MKDLSLYRPTTFKEYIGQDKPKLILQGFLKGTAKLNKTFPHILIHGNAGCGKTTLARIIAKELDKPLFEVISSETNHTEIIDFIREKKGGVIFVDEVHSLKKKYVEPLYPVMEDYKFGTTRLPNFTFIGATTEIGELKRKRKPFYDRFVLKQELEPYTVSNLEKIAYQYNVRCFPKNILKKQISIIAENARLTPRVAISLTQATIYLNGNVKTALANSNIIWKGLTTTDMRVLDLISRHFSGIGVNAIASYLGTAPENYLFEIEPYLFQNDLISKTNKGRRINEKGTKVLEILKGLSKHGR